MLKNRLEIPEIKNMIVEIKSSISGLNNRAVTVEEKICNLKTGPVPSFKTEDKDPGSTKEK